MSLLDGFYNCLVDIQRLSLTENDYGGGNQILTTIFSDVECKLDYGHSGYYPRFNIGNVDKSGSIILFCEVIAMYPGDRVVNIRNIDTGVVRDSKIYQIENVTNPGSEDSHLEVILKIIEGEE